MLIAIDTSARMQFDADGNYYDPYDYTAGNLWDSSLGVNGAASKYRRMYEAFQYTASGSPKYQTSTITVVGNQASQLAAYNAFYAKTRLGVAKAGVLQAIAENTKSARFGLIAMRQANPRVPAPLNDGEVQDNDRQSVVPDRRERAGTVEGDAGSRRCQQRHARQRARRWSKPTRSSPNTDIATILNRALTASGATPAGWQRRSVGRLTRRSRTCWTTCAPRRRG